MAAPMAEDEDISLIDDDEVTLCDKVNSEQGHEFPESGAGIPPKNESIEIHLLENHWQLSSEKPSKIAQRQVEEFLEMMDTQKSNYSMKLLDLRTKYSWDDMMKAADEAHGKYEAAGNSPIRKAGHWVTARSEMAQPFLRLIPSDTYLSILYGGLRLVFEAFSNVHEKRVKVLKSFLRIPNIIIMAESCVKNFPSDEDLFRKAEDVFCAALPAIEGTIRWLKQGSFMKPLRALALGPDYTKSYKGKLQALDEALNELQERLIILRDQAIQETRQKVDSVQLTVNRTDTQMFMMTEDIKYISKNQDETRAKVENLNDLEQVKEQAKEAIRVVLEQTVMTSQWMKDKDRAIRRLKKQVEALERAEVNLSEADLLDILKVGENLANQDFRSIQRACQSVELSEIETASNIVGGARLQSWLSTDASSALFIDGASSHSMERTTPLSFLCTTVIESLRHQKPAVPIYFFCGSHTSLRDPLRGPCGMMKSLLSQVARIYPPKLDFISRPYRKQLEALHLYTLCDCFCKLVGGLTSDTVLVCILDSISFLETNEWASGCKEIMSHLQGLLEDDHLNPVFKLLVTSPVRSRYAGSTFADGCRLTLSKDDSANARHRISEREAAMSDPRLARFDVGRRRSAPSSRRKRFLFHQNVKHLETSQRDLDSDSSSGKDEATSGKVSEMELDNAWPELPNLKG